MRIDTGACFVAALLTASLSAGLASALPHRGCRQGRPERYEALISRACGRWDLDADLLRGLLQQESRFDAEATSPTGAAGLAQFTSIGAAEVRRLAGLRRAAAAFDEDPGRLEALRAFDKRAAYEPELAIEGAALFLAHLLRVYDGHEAAALTHYNAGSRAARAVQAEGFEAARRAGKLRASQASDYAPAVLAWRDRFAAGWRPGE